MGSVIIPGILTIELGDTHMKIMKHARGPLYILLVIGLMTSGCDKEEDGTDSLLMAGMGCAATSPLTMRSTTYNMTDQVIGISEQVIQNMAVASSQPEMYEMYAGVELTIDVLEYLSDPDNIMNLITQNPILTQFWALKKMATSTDAGGDGDWMTPDDTIDPLLGYFETTKQDGRYRLIAFDDFGVTPSGRTDFILDDGRKARTYDYAAGDDGDYGTDDDEVTRTTVYEYNGAGKMLRAKNYAADEITFQSSYKFTYDENGRLLNMRGYSNEAETSRLDWGSYSNLTWEENEGIVSVDIELGLRIWILFSIDTPLMHFHIEFNEDGTMRKMVMYEALSSSSIDTCYVYEYSGEGLLGISGMSTGSRNYSGDETDQVSYTVNELIFGEK